jgi:hemolysin III
MEFPVKPRLRGWSHAVGAVFAVIGAGALIILSREQPAKAVTMAIYGLSLILLLGMSAVYHIGTWRPRVRAILRGLDHANIFLFIAASYTAVVFNAVTGYWRIGILVSIWLLAVVGMVLLVNLVLYFDPANRF